MRSAPCIKRLATLTIGRRRTNAGRVRTLETLMNWSSLNARWRMCGDLGGRDEGNTHLDLTLGTIAIGLAEQTADLAVTNTENRLMQSLEKLLKENHDAITKRLYLGKGSWCSLLEAVCKAERTSPALFKDEQVWTFLAACGYAIDCKGVEKLTKILTDSDLPQPDCAKIWMEVLPFPPRKREGNTNLDLALGTIKCREGTTGGIKLGDQSPSWICFCEMKWYSDISTSVKYDIHRNQLARVIENALYFNDGDGHSDCVYVALVTPKAFKNTNVKSRLYQYKFEEYEADRGHLVKDFEACVLEEKREHAIGNVADRVKRLILRWPTYDEIFTNIPDSAISKELKKFWQERGKYQGRS